MTAYDIAMTLWEKGEVKQAIPHFQRALVEQPDNLNVIYRTILTLVAMRDYAGCAKWLGELLPHIDGEKTEAWLMAGLYYNYGVALEASGQWENARDQYQLALKHNPQAVQARVNLGGIHYRLGLPDLAKLQHDIVLATETLDPEARPSVAFLKMLRGDYVNGFKEYDGRWRLPQVISQSYVPKNAKRWYGGHLEFGKRILVVGEQGVGDVLMMARYIPKLVAMGLRPVLVVHSGLVRLIKASFPDFEVTAIGEPHKQAGYWVPMMSLPRCFQTTLDTIPDPVWVDLWALFRSDVTPLFPPTWKSRVGLVARGNPLHMGDKDRSCHDDTAWKLLLDTPGIEFMDLSEPVLKDRYGIRDMADTASIVAQCDLIISIDSAIAHLAGSMGKPVWLLPPSSPEWRWGMPSGEMVERGSRWYGSHTLYRRSHVNDWPAVIERVRQDLEAL